jgi:hypothetical protein
MNKYDSKELAKYLKLVDVVIVNYGLRYVWKEVTLILPKQ